MEGTVGIYAALAQAQAEMKSPAKDKEGQVGPRKYMYASLDACLDAVKPPLNARGVFLTQRSVKAPDGQLFIETIVATDAECLVLDCEPYEYDTNPQEYGKRETYAKRYSLCKAFALVGDEDTDGDVQTAPQPTRAPQRPVQARPPAQTKTDTPESRRRALVASVIELKKRCIGAGVSEEGINEWYAANFGEGTSPNRLSEAQLRMAVDYLEQLEADANDALQALQGVGA